MISKKAQAWLNSPTSMSAWNGLVVWDPNNIAISVNGPTLLLAIFLFLLAFVSC